jgi:nucleotide-binding universal stress UspA family protein
VDARVIDGGGSFLIPGLCDMHVHFAIPAVDSEFEASNRIYALQFLANGIAAVPCATPKELILEEAHKWGADLIVVGSHGRRGVNRFLLGSVSEAVASHARCSVEIARHRG